MLIMTKYILWQCFAITIISRLQTAEVFDGQLAVIVQIAGKESIVRQFLLFDKIFCGGVEIEGVDVAFAAEIAFDDGIISFRFPIV